MTSPSVVGLSLRYGGAFTLAIAVVGSLIGFLVAGVAGLVSALIGALLAAVFMALTALSIVLANRLSPNGESSGRYFAVIAGAWAIKMVAFVIVALQLRQQDWLNGAVFFIAALVAVAGSLLADGMALARARVPYVGNIALPGDE
jgi:fructose-specific phosphotransferase system IIC component